MTTLTIPLKAVYFNQIKAGTKTHEFRLVNEYWRRRLLGRKYDQLVLTSGYPKAGDTERRMTMPWRGFTVQTIKHEHFGSDSVEVFAINVSAPE